MDYQNPTSMDDRTNPYQELAGLLLDRPIGEYIAERRAANRSWRLIARDLMNDTDGKIDVTEATLRNWFGEAAA